LLPGIFTENKFLRKVAQKYLLLPNHQSGEKNFFTADENGENLSD
jgi:hypothetical protein